MMRRALQWLDLTVARVARRAADASSGCSTPRVRLPTLGGKQFWADELFVHQWHIQRNVLTGHCRLLDSRQRRHVWGSFETCFDQLEKIRRAEKWPPMSGRAVLVLHGLMRTSHAMRGMARHLREAGFTVINVAYPTTRAPLEEHARRLAGIVAGLEGIEEINFVAHSLGNLVIRRFLADANDPSVACLPDPRIRRIVMLGPPNNGARLAEVLGRNPLYEWVMGRSAVQIRDWSQSAAPLATPACEFGIIAGGRGGARGFNPVLAGDNDWVVSVETTRLAGAADFVVLPVRHTFMMDDELVRQYTRQFLATGCFISADKRQPIANQP